MRVLVLSGATYAEPTTRGLYDHAARKGIDITLAMPRRTKHPFAPPDVPETPWPTPGVRLVRLYTWYLHENGTHILMKGIRRLVRDVAPDVIHLVMEPWSLTCLQVLSCIGRLARRPRLVLQSAESKPEQGGRVARALRRRLYRGVLARCDAFVGWSQPVLRAAQRLGLDGIPSCCAPAVGVDTELFSPVSDQERALLREEIGLGRDGCFLAGFAGRFVDEKGVTDLLAAADQVAQRVPRFRLLLVGTGPLGTALSTAASTRPWLTLHGPQPRMELARHLKAMDLTVLPSRTTITGEEQFGLVIAESMACGVPVVGTSCGAIPEVIGDAGWIVPERSPTALADRMTLAAGDAEGLGEMSVRARERSVRLYSEASVAARIASLWMSLE